MDSNDSEGLRTGVVKDGGPRPVIGLPTYAEPARFGSWHVDSVVLPASYVQMVVAAGGIPVLLPPAGVARPELVARLDGLVLTGGADVAPARYGAREHALTYTRPDRDESEFELVALARAARLPVLAVCRGMQVVNVALGGTLVQHLPDVVGHAEHSGTVGGFTVTEVVTVAGSKVAAIAGPQVKANCHHHQAIDVLATELVATAHATDGTIEAAETADGPFLVGVQWHPEVDAVDRRLIGALVAAAEDYRRERIS
ncbi:gamma-glutamyl-gamma-aminobutyrate hydrolase family protein [Nocardia sp. XZ_19_369]|uniref:gamma-glutamyl-gamma-aminobutyrate hydrolase family protein n=1 Tax=Nocardia sp. XZ_19_369 TaxID=2769487 RepID=UPI0027D203D4|nr:gamma-glutamyl-gamma-aminobutyrate hydrolase family protein [Nocardia sp. XZ_19_369]